MENQLRNWLYYTWLSGDHITEQHVHNLDVMNWCFGGPPISAMSMGGRQVRTQEIYGNIFDHFATELTYPGGVKVLSMCRQIDGCANSVSEHLVGTKGHANPAQEIFGENAWRYGSGDAKAAGSGGVMAAKDRNPYEQEHMDLVASIRAGEPLNEGIRIAESTLTAIMSRMSAYTGKTVTWDQAMKSTLSLLPEKLEFGPIATPPVAVPGKDAVV
jgi:predicted dehydrogenase